jgi:hypothetical protein
MKTESKAPGTSGLARRIAVAAALFAACTALGSARALGADEVALWHYKITVNSVVSGDAVTPDVPNIAGGSASVEENLTPLILEFDVNQNVEPIRDTLKASYTWASKSMMALEGQRLGDSEGHGQGSSLEDWEVVLTRHFNPIGCDSYFHVNDDFERTFAPELPPFKYTIPDYTAPDPKKGPTPRQLWKMRVDAINADNEQGDRLEFSIRALFPVTIISNDYINGATFKETSISSFQDSGEVEYSYQLETQGRRLSPETGVYGTGVILPKINLSRYRIDLDITRKPVELTLSASQGKGKGSTIRFQNKITVGGVECSRLFKVHRLERDWFFMADPTGVNESWEVVNDWHDVTDDGNLAAERDVSFDSFFPPKDARSKWGDRLYTAEFLDTVERLPELGFLYHVVYLITTENGKPPMEIAAFSAQKVDADRWCELLQRKEFRTLGLSETKELMRKKLP